MRFVKKLLRFVPIIFIVCMFLYPLLNHNFTNDNYVTALNTNFNSLFTSTMFGTFTYVTGFNSLWTWIQTNLLGGNPNMFLRTAYFTLWYELVCSLLFLIFDVFNFILGIANKWINKGENI